MGHFFFGARARLSLLNPQHCAFGAKNPRISCGIVLLCGRWQMWARWKENSGASPRVKQCVKILMDDGAEDSTLCLPPSRDVSKEPAYLLTAREAGSPCLDLSQHVSVTRAIMSDLISKGFPAAPVQARPPYLLHVEDTNPSFKGLLLMNSGWRFSG